MGGRMSGVPQDATSGRLEPGPTIHLQVRLFVHISVVELGALVHSRFGRAHQSRFAARPLWGVLNEIDFANIMTYFGASSLLGSIAFLSFGVTIARSMSAG